METARDGVSVITLEESGPKKVENDEANEKKKKKKPQFKYCTVPLCRTRSDDYEEDGSKVSFHEYPSNSFYRKLWVDAIAEPGSDFQPGQKTLVCNKHFDSSHYKPMANGGRRLSPQAVPTIMVPNVPQPKTTKKRKKNSKTKGTNKKSKATASQTELAESASGTVDESDSSISHCAQTDNIESKDTKQRNSDKQAAQKGSQGGLKKPMKPKGVDVNIGCRLINPMDMAKYKREKNRMRMQKKRMEIKMERLKVEYELYEKKWETWKNSINLLRQIHSDAVKNKPAACFLLDQLRNYNKKRPLWSDASLRNCLVWRMSGTIGYDRAFRSNIMKLPSKSTLNKHLSTRVGEIGMSKQIEDSLKARVQNTEDNNKSVSLVIENMPIKEQLYYNVSDKPMVADKLLCAVLQGLNKKFIVPVAYHFMKGLNESTVNNFTVDIIKTVEEIGYRVSKVMVDNEKLNVKRVENVGLDNVEVAVENADVVVETDLSMLSTTAISVLNVLPGATEGEVSYVNVVPESSTPSTANVPLITSPTSLVKAQSLLTPVCVTGTPRSPLPTSISIVTVPSGPLSPDAMNAIPASFSSVTSVISESASTSTASERPIGTSDATCSLNNLPMAASDNVGVCDPVTKI